MNPFAVLLIVLLAPGAFAQAGPGAGVNQGSAIVPVDKKKAALDSYIEGQVKRERDRYDRYYKGLERNALETGKYKAAQTRATINPSTVQQWSRDKDKTYVPLHERIPGYVPSSLNNGRGGNIGDGKVRPYADSASTSQEIEWARMKEQMADEKADEYRKRASEKKALLEESANNLKSQMQESNVPGAAIVKAHGSNLYVRYYGSDDQARKTVDVRPAAARIIPHQ